MLKDDHEGLPPLAKYDEERHRTKSARLDDKDLLGRTKVIGLKSHGEGVNPKDKIGASKVDFTLLPLSAKVAWALAQMDGADKYGAYNWRIEPVQARTYIAAAERHLSDYNEGQEVASDSQILHLGHVMACCAILIDAAQQGKLVDDRPINNKPEGISSIAWANDWIKLQKPKGWGR